MGLIKCNFSFLEKKFLNIKSLFNNKKNEYNKIINKNVCNFDKIQGLHKIKDNEKPSAFK